MTKRTSFLSVFALFAVAAGGCGDDSKRCGQGTVALDGVCVPDGSGSAACGAGTFEFNGECVPFDPNDATAPTTTADPPGAASREPIAFVTLSSDEPATIYYTTDGSEPTTSSAFGLNSIVVPLGMSADVKFFAVDATGNTEATQTEQYVLDLVGPGPVTTLAAAANAPNIDLTWVNPTDADFAGVVVLASANGPTDLAPTDGVEVLPGQFVGTARVEAVGDAALVAFNDPADGAIDYSVYAFDALFNYSVVAQTSATVPVSPQTGQLSVDLATGAVTVVNAPQSMSVAGTAQLNGTDLSIDLTFSSFIGASQYNSKFVATAINEGTLSQDGDVAGDPYAYIEAALGGGATAQRGLFLSGVSGNVDPIVIDFAIATHPMVVQRSALRDSHDSNRVGSLSGNTAIGAALSVDGTRIFTGSRQSSPIVAVHDTRTLTRIATINLAFDSTVPFDGDGFMGRVTGVAVSPDGLMVYATHSTRCTGQTDSGGDTRPSDPADFRAEVVKIDTQTLEIVDRLLIGEATANGDMLGAPAITSDGSRLAFANPSSRVVHFVDLATFTEIDTDAVTGGIQSVDLSSFGGSPRWVAFNADDSNLAVAHNSASAANITLVNTVTFAAASAASTGGQSGMRDMRLGPDGNFWISEFQGLRVMAPDGSTETAVAVNAQTVAFSADGTTAFVSSPNGYTPVNVSDLVVSAEVSGSSVDGGHYSLVLGD